MDNHSDKMSGISFLYIDFTHSLPHKGVKFHGGGNYTKTLILNLEKYILAGNNSNTKVIIIWPKSYIPQNDVEKRILNSKAFGVLKTEKSLDEINYRDNSRLFLPLLGIKEFPIIKKVKANHPQLQVMITVHGLRLLDYNVDKYDEIYLTSAKDRVIYWCKDVMLAPVIKNIYKTYIKMYLRLCDDIITVSNYSLGRIFELVPDKKIFVMTQEIITPVYQNEKHTINPNYMLFVSGGVSVKNLARTIVAYKKYLQRNPKIRTMIVTGIGDELSKNLEKKLDLSSLIANRELILKGYVSQDELNELYDNAAYLVYTSKSEGYGLPVMEAASHGCPSLAAIGTSIPEVLWKSNTQKIL